MENKQSTVEGVSDDEVKEHTKDNVKTSLDVAFVLDVTGSMNPYIESCKNNILSISSKINDECKNCDVQFALVSYRDIPPQDHSFITKILNFTPIPFQIQIELSQLSAKGGGDQPECLTSALYDCYKNLNWRKQSIRIIIVITDAPPHGLEQNVTDGFPNGDIDTFNQKPEEGNNSELKKYLNVIDIVKAIRDDLKAVIYSIACEPDLSCDNDFANDFMQYIAEYTKGKFLPLSSATLLPDVIVGSVKQQIILNNLTYKLDEEIQKIKDEHDNDISSTEINKIIMSKWKNEGIKRKEISIGTLYRNKRSRFNINLLLNEQKIKSLKDFKANCKLLERLKESDFRHLNVDNNVKKINLLNSSCMGDIHSYVPTLPMHSPPSNPMIDFSPAPLLYPITEKESIKNAFDEFIDPEQNGDVDIEEWCLGMQTLKAELTVMQQREIYRWMDKGGYIERNDFVTFGTAEFAIDDVKLKPFGKKYEYLVFRYINNLHMLLDVEYNSFRNVESTISRTILSYFCIFVLHEYQGKILEAIENSDIHLGCVAMDNDMLMYSDDLMSHNNEMFGVSMINPPSILPQINGLMGRIPLGNINNCILQSGSCSPQRCYSREASLSPGYMEDVAHRLNAMKSNPYNM